MGTVYKNNGYWYYQTYVVQSDGKRVRKQFSLHTQDDSKVEDFKREWDRRVSQGLFSSPRYLFQKCVEDHLQKREWLVKHGELSENTIRSDEGSFKQFGNFIDTLPQPIYVDQFDGESGEKIIREYIEYRRNSKISQNTIRRDLRHVSILFTSLQKKKSSENGPRISVNPFTGLTLPKPTKRRDFPEQSDWIFLRDYLRDWVSTKPYDWFKTLIHFQIETGCRISEILTLKWEQGEEDKTIGGGHSFSYLSRDFKRWYLYSKRRERELPLEKLGPEKLDLTHVIKKIPRRSDSIYVFENPETERPYLVSSVSRIFGRLLDEVFTDENGKVTLQKRFSTHGLRHGFCSFCLNHGISPYQVGQIVGHSTSQITELYGHVDHEILKSVFKKLQEDSTPKPKSRKKSSKSKSPQQKSKTRQTKTKITEPLTTHQPEMV
jgi:integrase